MRVGLRPATWRGDWREWIRERETFWGLSIGRSGTKFLAGLLATAPGASVHHEPRDEDGRGFRRAYGDEEAAARDLAGFVLPEIYYRERGADPRVYGEVNPLLRRHASALRSLVPEGKLFHLVRDGRYVVRSIYARSTLTPEDEKTAFLLREVSGPPPGPRGEVTRFDWICWYWREENEYLRRHTDWTVRFEDLLAGYDAFRSGVLEPLGLEVGRVTWSRAVERPSNVTEEHELPSPDGWSAERERRFWEICGEEMRACGYGRETGPGDG